MPVKCEIDIESVSTDAFAALDYVVMGHAFKCQHQFGRLADERIYEANLSSRLNAIRLESLRQVPVVVSHGSFLKTYFLDLIVSRKGVYELKTVAELTKEHVAQLLTYLYLLDLPRGKLINFRPSRVESKFVNAPLSRSARTSFAIASYEFSGESRLIDLTVNLLMDLGTSLSVSLYEEILVQLLGGEEFADVMLPISDGNTHLGNQRFQLASTKESLRTTCFSRIPDDYEQQLRSLLQFSPLMATQWIDIDSKAVTFKSIIKN